MKTKKLEKKTAFTYKKAIVSLSKDEMRKINGGGGPTDGGGFSGNPDCEQNKTIQQTISQ